MEGLLRSTSRWRLFEDRSTGRLRTYRIKSDFVAPYGKWVYYNGSTYEHTGPLRDFTVSKTKKVAGFVSNCNANNNRLQYALQIQNYVQFDFLTYTCGTYSYSTSSEQTCFEMMAKSYKLYLAFENFNSVE